MASAPHLSLPRLDPRTRAVVLLLHGGTEVGTEPVTRWAGPPLRMVPFGWSIRRRDRTVAVARMRYRCRGWNGAAADPVADLEDALARIDGHRPGVPVVLVGHSMGGRAAIRAAGDPHTIGIVALAPWIPRDDPVEQVAGKDVVVIHGSDDHRTAPENSARFAAAVTGVARSVEYVTIPGGDHAMLRHAPTWHRLTADAVASMTDRLHP